MYFQSFMLAFAALTTSVKARTNNLSAEPVIELFQKYANATDNIISPLTQIGSSGSVEELQTAVDGNIDELKDLTETFSDATLSVTTDETSGVCEAYTTVERKQRTMAEEVRSRLDDLLAQNGKDVASEILITLEPGVIIFQEEIYYNVAKDCAGGGPIGEGSALAQEYVDLILSLT